MCLKTRCLDLFTKISFDKASHTDVLKVVREAHQARADGKISDEQLQGVMDLSTKVTDARVSMQDLYETYQADDAGDKEREGTQVDNEDR